MALDTKQSETLADMQNRTRGLQEDLARAGTSLETFADTATTIAPLAKELEDVGAAARDVEEAAQSAGRGMETLGGRSARTGESMRRAFGREAMGALHAEVSGGMSVIGMLYEESLHALAMVFDQRYSLVYKGTMRELALEMKAQKEREKFNKNMIGFAKTAFGQLAGLKEELVEAMSSGDWSGLFLSFIDVLADMAIQMGTYFILAATGFALLGDLSKAAAGAIGAALVALGLAWKAGRAIAQAASGGGGEAAPAGATAAAGYGSAPPVQGQDSGEGRTVIININAEGSLDTADVIARRLDEVMRREGLWGTPMADSRHVYWWSVPRIEEGAGRNVDWRVYNGTQYFELTDIGEEGTTSWSSIYHLCGDVQQKLRSFDGCQQATVYVDLNAGRVVVNTQGVSLLQPAPATDAQRAFNALLGGDAGTIPLAPVFVFPSVHAGGVYIADAVAVDGGDTPVLTAETATSLAGAARMYRWGTGYRRKLTYQWLSREQMEGLRQMFADSPQAVILLDDPVMDWWDIAGMPLPNYIIEKPAEFPGKQPVPGLPRYHVSWTLGRR